MLVDFAWDQLRELRVRAAHDGLKARTEGVVVRHLAKPLLTIAEHGLRARGFGEEAFLWPLSERLAWHGEPARGVRDSYSRGGVQELIHDYAWA
jgi:gamma-glutamylcysteine synthetase